MKKKAKQYQATEIAKMYFLEHMTQEQIAEITNFSRPNISRIINRCLSDGTVEIRIHDKMCKMPEVASKIKKKWKLDDVFISTTSMVKEKTLQSLGELVAEYLMMKLEDDMCLGTTAGEISCYAAHAIRNTENIRADTVQLIGDTKAVYSLESGQGLASLFAQHLGGKCYILQAPIFVKNTATKNALLSHSIISSCFSKYASIDIALLEIDLPQLHRNMLPMQSWLSQADMVQLNEVGAVSSICGRYFDSNGYPCNANINERVIGIDIEDLRRIPLKIGLAVGANLSLAVLSCLQAHLLNVLVIDEALAKKVAAEGASM